MNYVTPAGFRDVLTDEAQQRERITRAVQERFAARGYLPIETPTLEVMDVMRAGGRLAGSPFRFFDARGDLLAMRPDVTLQVARMTATRLAGQPGPFRFRYLQRVFREAEAEMQAKARELTQMGIECIGEEGPEADAEVVGLLAEALDVAGARGYTLALATVGVLRALLEASGAPAWWKEQVLDAYHASNFVELDRLTAPAGAGPSP
ncbi:MAG: ATP phosphoribosyltransferase regulatory subunit, partial [Gordonibacter urolithinfaciens]